MVIRFKGLGFNLEVQCEEGASCEEAVAVFESLTSKAISGMDLYANGEKIEDLGQEAPEEIVAVKSKHQSA